MFQTKFVEKIKTHILCSVTFFENKAVYQKLCKNIVVWGRAHDMMHAHCLLDT